VPSWASGPASEIPAAIPLLVTWPANLAELVVPVDLALQKKVKCVDDISQRNSNKTLHIYAA
jgi:hypothetical protein